MEISDFIAFLQADKSESFTWFDFETRNELKARSFSIRNIRDMRKYYAYRFMVVM